MPPLVLGLDIGGANLKAADSTGACRSVPFAVWKHLGELTDALVELVASFSPADAWAVTMTAELCDCFATKREGVAAILDAVSRAAAARGMSLQMILVWQADGQWATLKEGRHDWRKTAAANWLALATLVGQHWPRGPALLIDVGSTTTDVIPLRDGVPIPRGRTDLERLANQELLYEGVGRTPICATLEDLDWRGFRIKPAAELFATTFDAYLLLGDVSENPEDFNTADGRPATRRHARARLARMLCAEEEEVTADEILAIAVQVKQAQCDRLARALRHVGLTSDWRVFAAGSGEFLAVETVGSCFPEIAVERFSQRMGPGLSSAACAYALAVLAMRRNMTT